MRDRRGMGEPGEGCARSLGDRRVEAGEAAQVELVDDKRLRRDAPAAGLARRRRAGDRLRRERPAVVAELEHRGMEAERPVEAPGVRIGQQFGGVEAGAARWIVWAIDAKAVARARPEAGREPAQDAVRVTGHRRAKDLAIAVVEAQRRAFGVGQDERGLEPLRAERRRRGPLECRSFGRPGESAIERGVSLRRTAPGDVRAHAVELEAPRPRRIAADLQRPVERMSERFDRGRKELDAGRHACRRWPPRWRRSRCRRGRRRARRSARRHSAERRAGSGRRARSATAPG